MGRLFAAGRRWVKLVDAPVCSRLDGIPGCCRVAVARLGNSVLRPKPGALKQSGPSVGGVGRVFSACAVDVCPGSVEEVAPGQYCALACC